MAANAAAGNADYTTEIASALNTANRDGHGAASLDVSPAAAGATGAPPPRPANADTDGARLVGATATATSATAADAGYADDTAGVAKGAASLHDKPTLSHALATADHEEKGAAQKAHTGADESYYANDQGDDEDGGGEAAGQGPGYGTDVKDLGWHDDVEQVPKPLVAGLSNEGLWMLIRRFDKQMYHVKATDEVPPGGLDLNTSPNEEFSPDKLRCNLERLYMTVAIGVLSVVKHVARLRSWRETRRTAAFCTVYFTAWWFDFLAPLMLATLLALIAYPPSRRFLFPPAPLALVNSRSGGVQKPKAGLLGSHDTLTGAPERHMGEAAEQEAHNFVSSLSTIGIGAVSGKQPNIAPGADKSVLDQAVPEPTNIGVRTTDAKGTVGGGTIASKHDKTKQPMEAMMWERARPLTRAMADVADIWERVANKPRLRLGAIMVPVLLVSCFLTSAVLVKSITFLIGGVFFGDPIIMRGLDYLNRNFPDWLSYLDLRNNLLLGVPTNVQLTLTLLRIGEAKKAPLPPPPRAGMPAPSQPPPVDGDALALDASNDEVQAAVQPQRQTPRGAAAEAARTPDELALKPKHGRRLLAFFKTGTRAGVTALLGTDRLKARAGSEHAKMRLGVLPRPAELRDNGPVDFRARLHGRRGHLYLITAAAPPRIEFWSEPTSLGSRAAAALRHPHQHLHLHNHHHHQHDGSSSSSSSSSSNDNNGDSSSNSNQQPIEFVVPLPDIRGLKKVGGLGWKSKLVVAWATEREIANGLEITDRFGHAYMLTAIPLRDELFNRLIAMGGQMWESY